MKDIIFKILIYLTVIYFLIYYYRLVLPYVEYEVNKEYIENNLCENRDKPWMNCHGKCHLKKQIKKASKEEKKHNPFITTENTLLFFLIEISFSKLYYSDSLLKNIYYYNFYNYIFISEILKPPQNLSLNNYYKEERVKKASLLGNLLSKLLLFAIV